MSQYEVQAYNGRQSKWLRVDVSATCVTIHNSVEVTDRVMQANVCKKIKSWLEVPDCIKTRSWRSLRNEWRAHNLLYRLPFTPASWKERLKDVDLDAEAFWRRAVYAILAAV